MSSYTQCHPYTQIIFRLAILIVLNPLIVEKWWVYLLIRNAFDQIHKFDEIQLKGVVNAVLWLSVGSIFIWWNSDAKSHTEKYCAPSNWSSNCQNVDNIRSGMRLRFFHLRLENLIPFSIICFPLCLPFWELSI